MAPIASGPDNLIVSGHGDHELISKLHPFIKQGLSKEFVEWRRYLCLLIVYPFIFEYIECEKLLGHLEGQPAVSQSIASSLLLSPLPCQKKTILHCLSVHFFICLLQNV